MGLFDDYVDPQQFNSGGGLLGRLLSLQKSQGLYTPGEGFGSDQSVQSAPTGTSSPMWPGYGQSLSYRQSAASDGGIQNQAFWPSNNAGISNLLSASTSTPQPYLTAANDQVAGRSPATNSKGSPAAFSICQLPDGQIVSYQDMGDGFGIIGGNGNGGLGFGLGRAASEAAMPTAPKTGGLAGGGTSGKFTSPASRILRDLTGKAYYAPLRSLSRTTSLGGSLAKSLPFWGAMLGFMDYLDMQNASVCSPAS